MVFILTMLFLISVTVAVVLETIDAINKARGKPSHYARMLGYLGEGFEGVCVFGIIVASFAVVISLGYLVVNLIIDFLKV